MHQLAGRQVLGANKTGGAGGGVEVEIEGGEDVARRRRPERAERAGTRHRAGRGVERCGPLGLHGQISARRLGAIGQAGDHREAAGGGHHIAAGPGTQRCCDTGAGTGATAGLGAAGGAAGAAGEIELGVGAEAEIVAGGAGTALGTEHLDVGFRQSRTLSAGGAERGRIGGVEVEAGPTAGEGDGVDEGLNSAHLRGQIEAIHAAEAEHTGGGITGDAGGRGRDRIGGRGLQAEGVAGLNPAQAGASAGELHTGDGADRISRGHRRAVGLQAAGTGCHHIDGGAIRFGTELKLTDAGNGIEDVVITIRLNTGVGAGEANAIAIDQREAGAGLADGEAIGCGRAVVDQGDGAERLVAGGLGGDTVVAAGCREQIESGAGLNAVAAGIGEVGIVDAVGAAGQASDGQAFDVGGCDGLKPAGCDREIQRIRGSQAGITATGRLHSAVGVDNKARCFGCGVGLDAAGKAERDAVAGGEAAAIGTKAVGSEH